MASIKLTGDTSGVITVSAPASAGTNTLTLPATTGTILDTNSALVSSKLTGALPAISGAALTGISSGGLTLLATIATASGTTLTTGSLDFSGYQQLHIVFNQVGHDHSGGAALDFNMNGNGVLAICAPIATGKSIRSHVLVDLNTNIIIFSGMPDSTTQTSGNSNMDGGGINSSVYKVGTNLKSASGTVACSWVGGHDFNVANSNFLVYGLK